MSSNDFRNYRPVAPSRYAEEIDAQVCAESTCGECGHVGMRYRPLTGPNGDYHAFAVCPRCRAEVEF